MKYLIKTMAMASVILLITFASCKKNEVRKEEEKPKFDINNPIGYFIYLKLANEDGTWIIPTLMEFRPGKRLLHHTAMGSQIYPYEVIDEHIISLVGLNYRFAIEEGKVTTEVARFKEVALLKAEETNLAGWKNLCRLLLQPR
ncbi:hypothetical protein [Pedobacter panaciterrae]